MISVPARRVKQFGVEFYQAGLSAKDIDRLVKFEVLGYSGGPEPEPTKASPYVGRPDDPKSSPTKNEKAELKTGVFDSAWSAPASLATDFQRSLSLAKQRSTVSNF